MNGTTLIVLIHKSHNALVPYPTTHHFVTEMCTRAHFYYRMVHCGTPAWCIVGFVRWVYSSLFTGGDPAGSVKGWTRALHGWDSRETPGDAGANGGVGTKEEWGLLKTWGGTQVRDTTVTSGDLINWLRPEQNGIFWYEKLCILKRFHCSCLPNIQLKISQL